MLAQRIYRPRRARDNLKVWVDGDLEGRNSVYFTDQSPEFTIHLENTGDIPINVNSISRISFDQSDKGSEQLGSVNITCKLEPGQEEQFIQEIDMLSYQGTAAISIEKMSLVEKSGEIQGSRISHNHVRLYTFMVYDRDYYEVNYLNPRRAQYTALVLSVLVVFVGILQVALALL